jgi:serine/threonine protein phosphatase PrpC
MAIDDRTEEEKAVLIEKAQIEREEKTAGWDEEDIDDLGAIVVSGLYTAKNLSRDHKPDDEEEAARITEWGGFIYHPPEPGLSSRVYLDPEHTVIGLAMARSIGDFAVKEVGVISTPEVKTFQLTPQDKFMILASDGVWEFITSQEAVDIVASNLENGCHAACEELIQVAATRWAEEEGDYRDDITASVVKFPLPHQPSHPQ